VRDPDPDPESAAATHHRLRSQLGTIGICAATLELEPDLTETGRIALKRINEAIVRAAREVERLEQIEPR